MTFLFARDLTALLVGRVLSGLSAGIASGTATAWLVDLAGRRGKQHATLLAVAANIGGLAFGPLVAGLLAGLAPAPLRLPFACRSGAAGARVARRMGCARAFGRSEAAPRAAHAEHARPPGGLRHLPAPATVGVCAFAVAGVFSAAAPEFLENELGDKSAVRAGLLVFLFLPYMAAAGQLTVNRIPEAPRAGRRVRGPACRSGIAGGGAGGEIDGAALSLGGRSSGLGEGLPVGFGLGAINEKVGDKRGETDSAYFVLLDRGVSALPVVGVGFLALGVGMVTAGLLFCGLVGLCVLGVLYTLRRRPA